MKARFDSTIEQVAEAGDIASTPPERTVSPGALEVALRGLAGGGACDDFEVIYDDRHGLWGGQRIAVNGVALAIDSVPPSGACAGGAWQLVPADLSRLAATLVALEVWRPLEVLVDPVTGMPPLPVPDQSFASLHVRVPTTEARLAGFLDGRLIAARRELLAWATRCIAERAR